MLNENETFSTSLRAVYTIPVGKKNRFSVHFHPLWDQGELRKLSGRHLNLG